MFGRKKKEPEYKKVSASDVSIANESELIPVPSNLTKDQVYQPKQFAPVMGPIPTRQTRESYPEQEVQPVPQRQSQPVQQPQQVRPVQQAVEQPTMNEPTEEEVIDLLAGYANRAIEYNRRVLELIQYIRQRQLE